MENFKTQYLAVMLADLPDDLAEELTADLSEWIYWEKSQLESFNLSLSAVKFLTEIGLPKVSNDIYCEEYDTKTLSSILDNHDLDKTYFPLGFDGCGSVFFLKTDNDCLYLCDHDNGNQMIFINSSLEKLAETLVLVAKFFVKKTIVNPLAELSQIDEKAVQENSFWCRVLKDK